jgi:threonine/homoserine/homoserine lactone efflux protein
VYGAIVLATCVLLGIHVLVAPGPIVAVALVAVTSAVLLWFSRDCLRVGDTFPELRRVPLLGRLVS